MLRYTLIISSLFISLSASAATITVNTTVDEYNTGTDCSLREAIEAANTNGAFGGCAGGDAGLDIIEIPGGDYDLTHGAGSNGNDDGDLEITESANLVGTPNGTPIVITAVSIDIRVLEVMSGASVEISNLEMTSGDTGGVGGAVLHAGVDLTLDNVTLSDNKCGTEGGGALAHKGTGTVHIRDSILEGNEDASLAGGGGAILHDSDSTTLIIERSMIRNNTTVRHGGGLHVESTINMTVIVRDSVFMMNDAGLTGGGIHSRPGLLIDSSTFIANESDRGGGVFLRSTGSAIINSTFSGNKALRHGGGIGGENGTIMLFNVTATENIADSDNDGDGRGGGIDAGGSNQQLNNTIISGNTDMSGTAPDCFAFNNVSVISNGFNLIGDTTGCNFSVVGQDQVGVNPLLGSLADNGGPLMPLIAGGPLQTYALLPGSPAIDAGDPDGCLDNESNILTVDQRGVSRDIDGDGNGTANCDIGAFEFESSCGDGIVHSGEECDDGNNSNGDGCAADCTDETSGGGGSIDCGDGVVDSGEECDDGNTTDGDGCSATCTDETTSTGTGGGCSLVR